MGWVKAYRRRGATLALLALVIQFACALGHVHLQGHVSHGPQIVAVHGEGLSAPQDGPGNRRADAPCDICAVVHMAAAPIATAAAAIVPALFVVTSHAVIADVARASPRNILPPSRAPPIV